MFDEKKISTLQKFFALKEINSANLFSYRLKKFLEKNAKIKKTKNGEEVEINQGAIISGIIMILEDLHKKEEIKAKEKIKVNLSGIKHPVLKVYGIEIIGLYKEGLGARRIKQILEMKYNAKISHVAIYNFLRQQKIEKD